jgi:hypothetical protein
MAELDPEKLGRVGIDPTTGSPLSQEVRNALLRKSTIDAATFRNEMSASENRRKEVDIQNAEVIRSQEQALGGFSSNILSLRNDIGKLGTGLASIALLLQQDGAEEQNRLRQEQETQRRLTERQVRVGKENEIEQKIQNALAAPVQNIAPKVSDTFGKIGAALGILFGGWLTKQTVDAIKASEEGNTKLFNEIKWNIIKGLGIVGGGLLAIKAGFGLVMRTIGGIGRGLSRLLIAKPLAIAAALLPKGQKPSARPPTKGPTRGGGGPGIFGSIFGGISAFMNARNGEYVDTAMIALSMFGPGRLVKGLIGIGYAADEIAEAFGLNIFGKDPNAQKRAAAVVEEALKLKNKAASGEFAKSTPSSAPPATAKPQTSMMGQVPSAPPAAAPTEAQPSTEMVKKFEMAWQYRNNSFARGRIESEWEKMTPEQKQMAVEWAKTKGYDWNEMKLQAPAASSVTPMVPPTEMSSAQQSTPGLAIPAQITTPPPAEPQRVGELPEAKPSLTMIKTSNGQNQQANVPLTNGPLSDVPFINSANPDNFYALYSQLNYNVVT